MNKYTPGPWESNNGLNGLIGTYIDGRKTWTLVADARDDGESSMQPGEAEANTQLIAAAPDLLVALEDCVRGLNHIASQLFPDTLERARAAIARAKGEIK